MTEYNIRLNPNCAAAVRTGLKFKAGDKGITFKIAVDELDTTGTTAKIVFQRANGTSVESDITGTDGVYTYKTLGNEFAVPGKTVADVKFYAADARVSTASFVFEVSGDTMDGLGAGAGGYSDRLEQLATEAEDAMKNAENVSKELENLLTVYQNKFGEVGVLNPKGTYNSATTYEAFDLVYYGGVSWLCLQRCTGVTPAEGAYWQLFASADGGNAAKLGGKGASEYFTKGGGDVYNGQSAHPMAIRGSGTPAYLDYKNGQGNMLGALGFYDANRPVFVTPDYSNSFALIHENNVRNYTAGNAEYLYVQHGNEVNFKGLTGIQGVYFNYRNGDTDDMDSSPIYWYAFGDKSCSGNNMVRIDLTQGSGVRDVLHTGNKPTGSYTGNGSATYREIQTGGVGNACIIWRDGMGAIVFPTGAAVFTASGFEWNPYIAFLNGAITMTTNSSLLNESGGTYNYRVA